MNQNKEHLRGEITQSILVLHRELASQRDVVQRFQNLRQFFIDQGFSTSLPDAMIAEWEERAQRTQHYIERGVMQWFEGLRADCLQKELPTADVDFVIAEWKEQVQSIQQ